jgi:dinuclear metal center YbgI/SA1388 family protein
MTTVADVCRSLETLAPLHLAAEWDNVGLLVGDRAASVERLMTCLTATSEVAEEAIREGVQLIVSHHPVLFRPTQKLVASASEGGMLLKLIAAGVAIYSPHTAWDNAPGGINDGIAQRLGLVDVEPLRPLETAAQCKIVVFVPDADLAKVSDALFAAGAGVIGQYSQCSYRLAGTGTFFGSDAANPTVGEKGRREEVAEWRLEVVCSSSRVYDAVRAMRRAHSYEEPAFDIYPLRGDGSRFGSGRVGNLPQEATLGELARKVESVLQSKCMQIVGDANRPVKRVGIACGAAGEFLKDAQRARADVFLTGELRFHDALAAQSSNVGVLIPGHFASERPGVEDLAAKLAKLHPNLQVWASKVEHDPLANC